MEVTMASKTTSVYELVLSSLLCLMWSVVDARKGKIPSLAQRTKIYIVAPQAVAAIHRYRHDCSMA